MSKLILIMAMLVPALLVLGCIAVWRLWRKADKRRSPLTFELRNLPGEGLRKQVARYDDEFSESAAVIVAVGPITLSAWLLARLDAAGVDWTALRFGAGDFIIFGFALLLLAWEMRRLIRSARRRRLYLDGLQAELAVAQCLTPLVAEGGMVFHDFPTGKYNIDHIVIGRSAVFAIETKWRRKPGYTGRDAARVKYDGEQLKFPGHTETKPIEQARYQAQWLADFLARGVGDPVRVIPVLALPGWYTEDTNRSARHEVLVSNCHNASSMVGEKFGAPMPEVLRKRIAHVISEKYPPLELH